MALRHEDRPAGRRRHAPRYSGRRARGLVVTPAKSSLIEKDGKVRLNQFLAMSGVCSRRAADGLIAGGRVEVNGQLVTELGVRVDPQQDDVRFDGARVFPERPVYVLFNKPKGVVCTSARHEQKKRVIGALNLLSSRPEQFTERDEAILRQFGAHVAVALENARLFDRERQYSATLETLAEIGQEVASILDLDELLERVAVLARRLIDYRTFGILLLNDAAGELEMKLAIRYGDKLNLPKVRLGAGIVGYAALHRQPVLVPDVSVDPRYIPLGVPVWLDTKALDGAPLQRLMVAQDVGSAIKGPIRGDLFWGTGEAALEFAGRMKNRGQYYVLLPKTVAARSTLTVSDLNSGGSN